MTLKADQQQVKALLTETITLLCKNGLHFKSEFCVEGLIGVTLDQDEVFLINIKETVVRTEQPPNANPALVSSSDCDENNDEEKPKDVHGMQEPPGPSKAPETERPPDAENSSAPSVAEGLSLVQAVVQSAPLPPTHKYQRSRSTVSFQTFEDLLPHNAGDLRLNDEYDLSLLAHSACVYGQQEGKLSTKLQGSDGGKKSCEEFPGVYAEDFSRQMESDQLLDVSGSSQVAESAGQKEGAVSGERPPKRPRVEGSEGVHITGIESSILESIAGSSSETNSISTAEQKASADVVSIKEEPSLDGLSLAYSAAMQAGHFELENGQNFPFSSSQRHLATSHSTTLVPGCSILDSSALELQTQARLAMLHLQLPARRYSIAGKMFHCLACGKALSSLHNLKLHEATVHRGLFQYRCPLCGKGLRQERDLRGHLANRHNMKKDFRCSICGNEFGYKRNLKQHMVSYHGWKDAVVQLPL